VKRSGGYDARLASGIWGGRGRASSPFERRAATEGRQDQPAVARGGAPLDRALAGDPEGGRSASVEVSGGVSGCGRGPAWSIWSISHGYGVAAV
jgi:hypothetical protein